MYMKQADDIDVILTDEEIEFVSGGHPAGWIVGAAAAGILSAVAGYVANRDRQPPSRPSRRR